MIYLTSFFRRLKLKSICWFSLVPALLILLFYPLPLSFMAFILSVAVLFSMSFLIKYGDFKKQTGIPCKLCSYGHCILLYPAKGRHLKQKGSFSCSSFDHGHHPPIYYCPQCKNGFLKSMLQEQYKQTQEEGNKLYAQVEDHVYTANISARHATYSKIIQKYKKYFHQKDILEIGTYYGAFYEKVKEKVKSYTGIEPSRHACRYLSSRHREINCLNNNLETVMEQGQLKDRKFDTIVLWDVMEHLPHPMDSLKNINTLLKKGGYLIFSTINIESTFSLLLGPYWPWFMDMHYYYFSDRGYVNMLDKTGFTLLSHSHFKYYVHLSYLQTKIKFLLFKGENPKGQDSKGPLIPISLGDTVMIIGEKSKDL